MAFLSGAFQHESTSWNDCVLASPIKSQNDDEDRHCRQCQSPNLFVDWAAGDRVCTDCGVVDEEHIRDSRPEWREFNDADDLAKGLPAAARCGLVPVDESKYLGGLQPTTLSKTVFGGGYNTRRKMLVNTNQRMDYMMEKQHAKALKAAKLSRDVRQQKLQRGEEDVLEQAECIRPEYEKLLLQEEEDAQRSKEALYAEKWSLERALLLHGHDEDTSTTHTPLYHGGQEEREDLMKRLDKPLLKASEELFNAYTLLQEASRKLHLPDRVLHEATAMLCKYATRRDGILVKGVSSRMSKSAKSDPNLDEKEAAERLRAYNKLKQNAALGSALLFLTARQLGWSRSLSEVCSSFQVIGGIIKGGNEALIKPKHCSRAMNEVRALFPHYGQASSETIHPAHSTFVDDADSIATFVEHSTRKLELPPVALASIRTLVQHFRTQQMETEPESMAKMSTICASISLFVCLAGASLQRLAQQAQSSDSIKSKRKRTSDVNPDTKPEKRLKCEGKESDEKSALMNRLFDEDTAAGEVTPDHESPLDADTKDDAFDVFSHSAVEYQESEKRKYEMRRIWDAWSEQMPWSRSISRIEQSCGVSRNVVLSFYKTRLFPRRQALLEVLQDDASVSSDVPLASVLLKNIATAAPLLNSKGQL